LIVGGIVKALVLVGGLLLSFTASALEINDASRAQLEQLNGVGVTMAEQMLTERAKAPFAGWDDLRKRVKGIGGKRMQEWQVQGVTVNGERGAGTGVAPAPAKEQGK
jgi:competence protein ComEA